MNKPNVIEDYYNKIIHFKASSPYIKDIDYLNDLIFENIDNDGQSEDALIYAMDKMSLKYKSTIDEVGKQSTGVMTIIEDGLYKDKTIYDLILESAYIIRMIVIHAVVKCGVEKSINDVMQTLKAANFDLLDL